MDRHKVRREVAVTQIDQHPNAGEVLGVLAQVAYISDADLCRLSELWCNSPALAAARDRALAPDSPLVIEVLAAFDAVGALFADDLLGEAAYVCVDPAVTVQALKSVRDAIAASYARPVLHRAEHQALMRPWSTVYPGPHTAETDLGPRGEQVKSLLATLPVLAGRCHDSAGRALFDALVDQSFVAEAERAEAAAEAFTAAVVTSRRRVWALVRRTGTEGLGRPCAACRRSAPADQSENRRVLTLCLDAACALLVADALPDSCTALLTEPVTSLIALQRSVAPST
jgi:hypothetical protein